MADKSFKPNSSNFPIFWYQWAHDDQYFCQPPQAPGFYHPMAPRHLTVFTNEIIKHYIMLTVKMSFLYLTLQVIWALVTYSFPKENLRVAFIFPYPVSEF